MSKNNNDKKLVDNYISSNITKSEIRDKYNAKESRTKYDDASKRKKFKESQFGDKQTIKDPYTGETLHKDRTAAKNKYGNSKYNNHTAQTDHTVSVEKIVNRNRSNRFLTDSDIKEIANITDNYKVINGHLNQSKGGNSNVVAAKKNKADSTQKKEMVKEQIKAEVKVAKKTAELTIKGMNSTGTEGAKAGAKASVVTSSAKNIKKLIDGEENPIEAICNVAMDTAEGATRGYCFSVVEKGFESAIDKTGEVVAKTSKKVAGEIAKKTGKEVTNNIGEQIGKEITEFSNNAEIIGKIVVITMELKPIAEAYYKGDIDKEIFIDQVEDKSIELACAFVGQEIGSVAGKKVGGSLGEAIGGVIGTYLAPGTGTVAAAELGVMVGTKIGDIVGSMIGYMVGITIYAEIKKNYPSISDLRKQISSYKSIERKLEEYTRKLENYYEAIGLMNTEIILRSFEEMKNSIMDNDVESFTYALQRVANLYGSQIRFMTDQQFVDFWNDPNAMMEI